MQKHTIIAVGAITAGLVFAGTTGAVAGSLIGSTDIRNNSVRSIDLRDGKGVGMADLKSGLLNKVDKTGADGTNGTNGADGADGTNGTNGTNGADGTPGQDVDASVLQDLRDRVNALEGNATTGHDLNTNWTLGSDGGPATIVEANTVLLDTTDEGYSYVTIKNLDLQVEPSTVIEYTYQLSDGATPAAGAPRLTIMIDGVRYSSVNQVNPDYGYDNGDGTFTVEVVATTGNSQTQNPNGTVTRSSLIYEGTGSITFTNVVVDGQPISFN